MQGRNGGNPSVVTIEGSAVASLSPHAQAQEMGDDGLNERQRAFVDWYCAGIPADLAVVPLLDGEGRARDVPAGDGYRSAAQAGYADVSAANMAARNLLKPKVQAEIERRVKFGKGSALLAGMSALHRIVERGTDERAVVAAAVALLDRFGLAAPKGPAVAVQINNMTGSAAQTILADVQRAREERLARDAAKGLPAPSGLFD